MSRVVNARRWRQFVGITSLTLLGALLAPQVVRAAVISSIPLNFNAIAIPADGRSVWFSSVFKPSNVPATGLTHIFITNSSIAISTDGTVAVPNAVITIDPTLNANVSGSAVTTFNTALNRWETTVPATGLAGNTFLDGLAWLVSSPAGNANATWTASFTTDRAGVTLQWQAAAAVYTTFSTNYNDLQIKPVDDNQASVYLNSDHAGTPEGPINPASPRYKTFVVGGATGGGGSNFTGSLSPTVSVTPDVPEPATSMLCLLVGAVLLKRRSL